MLEYWMDGINCLPNALRYALSALRPERIKCNG
jgi:hypothetical protein